jgi:hypothetical protein
MVNKPMIGVAAAVVVVAGGVWYYLASRQAPAPPPVTVEAPPAPPPTPTPAIQHPLPSAAADAASQTPLPALADSDAAMNQALGALLGAGTLKEYLLPENLIRHLVVTIDNLPRSKVAVAKRPTAPVPGAFVADGDELHASIDPQNYARYEPMVAVVARLDMRQLAAVYVRFYPLFQQAYQDLGYPNGYFNDRLVQVIDDLLAAPQPEGPVELTRPNVMYTFADPGLESRSAGQKLLIRMGTDNESVIKTKLKDLRAAITAAPPKR